MAGECRSYDTGGGGWQGRFAGQTGGLGCVVVGCVLVARKHRGVVVGVENARAQVFVRAGDHVLQLCGDGRVQGIVAHSGLQIQII